MVVIACASSLAMAEEPTSAASLFTPYVSSIEIERQIGFDAKGNVTGFDNDFEVRLSVLIPKERMIGYENFSFEGIFTDADEEIVSTSSSSGNRAERLRSYIESYSTSLSSSFSSYMYFQHPAKPFDGLKNVSGDFTAYLVPEKPKVQQIVVPDLKAVSGKVLGVKGYEGVYFSLSSPSKDRLRIGGSREWLWMLKNIDVMDAGGSVATARPYTSRLSDNNNPYLEIRVTGLKDNAKIRIQYWTEVEKVHVPFNIESVKFQPAPIAMSHGR